VYSAVLLNMLFADWQSCEFKSPRYSYSSISPGHEKGEPAGGLFVLLSNLWEQILTQSVKPDYIYHLCFKPIKSKRVTWRQRRESKQAVVRMAFTIWFAYKLWERRKSSNKNAVMLCSWSHS